MPKTLTQQEVDELKDRIVAAAERILAKDGLPGLTLRALATEMNCSQMLPYRYFRDKEGIIAAVRTRAFTRFSEALEAPSPVPADPEDFSARVGDAYVEFAFAHPQLYRLMFDLAPVERGRYPELDMAVERARRTMTEHIKQNIRQGTLAGDAEIIGRLYWAGLHGLIVLQLSGQLGTEPGFAKLRNAMFETFRASLSPKGA